MYYTLIKNLWKCDSFCQTVKIRRKAKWKLNYLNNILINWKLFLQRKFELIRPIDLVYISSFYFITLLCLNSSPFCFHEPSSENSKLLYFHVCSIIISLFWPCWYRQNQNQAKQNQHPLPKSQWSICY